MKGSLERLALLCAAAGVTVNEWEDFVSEIRQTGSDETRRTYSRIRAQMRALERDLYSEDTVASSNSELTASSAVRDINRLIDEADLSTPAATRRLIGEMQKQRSDFDTERFRFNAKEGLRRWLSKLFREYGESFVLSAAASAFRGKLSSDWRLA